MLLGSLAPYQYFGASVDVNENGDELIVGEVVTNSVYGYPCAYHYKKTSGTWTQMQLLHNHVSSLMGRYGTGLAILGNAVFVGAPYDRTTTGSDRKPLLVLFLNLKSMSFTSFICTI